LNVNKLLHAKIRGCLSGRTVDTTFVIIVLTNWSKLWY